LAATLERAPATGHELGARQPARLLVLARSHAVGLVLARNRVPREGLTKICNEQKIEQNMT